MPVCARARERPSRSSGLVQHAPTQCSLDVTSESLQTKCVHLIPRARRARAVVDAACSAMGAGLQARSRTPIALERLVQHAPTRCARDVTSESLQTKCVHPVPCARRARSVVDAACSAPRLILIFSSFCRLLAADFTMPSLWIHQVDRPSRPSVLSSPFAVEIDPRVPMNSLELSLAVPIFQIAFDT